MAKIFLKLQHNHYIIAPLQTQLKNTKDSLDKLSKQMGNVESVGLTSADFDQLNTLKLTVAALADEKEGTPALVQGVSKLQSQLGKLSGGVSDLNAGMNQVIYQKTVIL